MRRLREVLREKGGLEREFWEKKNEI